MTVPKKQPNILLLFPDSHRGDWMPFDPETFRELGMDGVPLRMPNIRALMEGGVTFTQAVTPAPLCAPARACLAAGVRYEACGTASNEADFPLDKKTYYSVLRDAGYRVAGVGKFDLHKPTRWWGLDGWIDDLGTLGFTEGIDNAGKIDAVVSGKDNPKDPYMSYLHDRGLAGLHVRDMNGRKGQGTNPTDLPEEAYCDNWLSNNGVQLLRNFPAGQPWFLMVNFTGPHGPWDVTKSMKESVADIAYPLPHRWDEDTGEKAIEIRRNYAAMLENIDRNIGLMLDEIRARGEWDNTIVVYSSDHGEMLGDFNRFGKCVPYRGSVHVPLVVRGPGIRQGIQSDALVELQDLAATFVDYAGSSMPEAVGSLSLKPLLEGERERHRDYQRSALDSDGRHTKHGWKMVTDGRYKLCLVEGRPPELFDLRQDPWENVNVANDRTTVLSRLLDQTTRQVSGLKPESGILYMAENGNDAWTGRLHEPDTSAADGPLKTLEGVKAKLGQLVRQGLVTDITVYVRGGTYVLLAPVIFSVADWPSRTSRLTIAAYPGETPVFSSGVKLGAWRKVEEGEVELPEAAKGHVWVADFPPELAGRKVYSLYEGEIRLPRARSVGFVPERRFERKGENWATEDKTILHFPAGSVRPDLNTEDVELVIRPTFQWVFNILPLRSVDMTSRTVRTAIPGTYPLMQIYNQPDRPVSCWLENALDFLDRPGEWVADSVRRKLYLWPMCEEPGAELRVPALREFIRLEGEEHTGVPVSGITISGLTFTHGERDVWTESDAGLQHDWEMFDKANALVRLRWAEHCRIEFCRFMDSGGTAIRLDLYAVANSVTGNEIARVGGTGIALCGYGPGTLDVNRSNRVEGNHIHRCGEAYWHAAAIFVWQSGSNRIAHNRIHHTPYNGIVISGVRSMHLQFKELRECSRTIRWEELGDLPDTIQDWESFVPYQHARDNIVECNELFAVMEKLGDGNAIYLSGAGDHNLIRDNYIHDVVDCQMQSAIRVDDFQRLTHIVGNLIYKCCGGGITLKHLNYVENNIIAHLLPVRAPDGTLTPPKGYILLRRGPSVGSTIQRNVLYKTIPEGDFYNEGKGIQEEWAKNCLTDHNLYWCAANPSESEALLERNRGDGIDGASLCADPMFAGAEEGDFTLSPDSPVYRLGFRPIRFAAAGE